MLNPDLSISPALDIGQNDYHARLGAQPALILGGKKIIIAVDEDSEYHFKILNIRDIFYELRKEEGFSYCQ